MAFASRTAGRWDYIPRAWDDWLRASDGVLLVALPSARGAPAVDAAGGPLDPRVPIALSRVVLLSQTEAWVEGIRVHPGLRGRSVATRLQVAELSWAAAHGVGVVRYVTNDDNEGSHRLGARGGFAVVGAWRGYVAPELEGTKDLPWVSDDEDRRVLEEGRAARHRLLAACARVGLVVDRAHIGPGVLDPLWRLIEGDPTFAQGRGMYEPRPWALQALTRDRFEAHLGRGEVLAGCVQRDAPPLAVAIVGSDAVTTADATLHLSLLAGEPDAAMTLAKMIRDRAGAPVRLRLPDLDPPLMDGRVDAWARVGYPARPHTNHLLERRLDDGSPPPAAEKEALLVLEDVAARVAVAPQL